MTVGEQIKEGRNNLNITQYQLKDMTGLSFDTVRRYEKDKAKRPSDFALRAFEKALNIKFEI